jgi:dihydrofolate synthase/folylpolyglutamate synthase
VASYEETIAWLQRLEVTSGWDLKLERMRAALATCGHPETAFPAVHVAGTNGKGSTAAMVEAVLRQAGRRTGLYTSPHLVDFAERVRAGGLTIPRDAVVALVDELRGALDRAGLALTHFEFCTVLAFVWFARIGIDVGVIEVGLGGRLDATNTVHPVATAVTSIARDHEDWLGHTLKQIAAEKAGIAKRGVPLVLGRLSADAAEVVLAHAAAVGAPALRAGHDGVLEDGVFRSVDGTTWSGLAPGVSGAFQAHNAEVALLLLAALRDRFGVTEQAVRAGLAAVRWPGRLAVVSERPRVVIDGAHNPAAVAALAEELPRLIGARHLVLVFAVMADKDWGAMLAALLPHAGELVATRVGPRGLDPHRLAGTLPPGMPVRVVDDARAAVTTAVARAGGDGAVLIAGSLLLAGAAYEALARERPLFEPWQGWWK